MGPNWESLLVADEGAGAPVLLVHGQPGGAQDWAGVRRHLGPGVRVLSVDRPGYGQSTSGPQSMAANAAVLADLVSGRVGAPAVVVGHSYGGGIALLMAAWHPQAVAGLVLVSSVGPTRSVNGFDHLLGLPVLGDALSAAGLFSVGRVLPRVGAVTRLLPVPLFDKMRASLPDHSHGAFGVGLRVWRSFVAEQRSLLAEIADVERAMEQVTVPTSVVTGTWDVVVPPSVAAELAASVPGAELVTVARTGHFVARDAPQVVAAAVRRTVGRAGS